MFKFIKQFFCIHDFFGPPVVRIDINYNLVSFPYLKRCMKCSKLKSIKFKEGNPYKDSRCLKK